MRISAQRYHGLMAFSLALVATVLVFFLCRFSWVWYEVLAAWLLAVNLLTLGYYAFDKSRAGRAGGRVPEVVLHALAVVGGTLGAYAGMRLFRHKTLKGQFRIVFWFTVVMQVALAVAVCYRLWQSR